VNIEDLRQSLTEIIGSLLKEKDLDLVELKVSQHGNQVNIGVLTDNSSGNIDLDRCVVINRAICDKLEAEGLIENSYIISVSSPGLDRPLVSQKDFLRVKGREVRFVLGQPVANRLEWVGVVQDANSEEVLIRYKNKGSCKKPPFPEEEIQLPIKKIKKATQII
jgi:ribosome maturation factor RimP